MRILLMLLAWSALAAHAAAPDDDCVFEHVEQDIKSYWFKDQAGAEMNLEKMARYVCNLYNGRLGPHTITGKDCMSEKITRPVISDGKISIQTAGTQWQCKGIVSCANPKKTCKKTSAAPSGATAQ